MNELLDPESVLSAIVGANRYLTLATADADGIPWASPVWYATADTREFFWVSSPDARHSRNVSVRPEVAIVIFDSRQPPGTGAGVYMSATAAQVLDSDLDRGMAVFSGVSRAQALADWSRADVQSPARHRLYHATAVQRFVLSPGDTRLPVNLG